MTALRPSLIRWTAAALYGARLTRPLSVALAYAGRASFPIFTYHRINDDDDPFFPATPVAVFEERIAYLARTCTVLTVDELVERMHRGRLPRNSVAVTFDDGYRDNLTHAAPILSRHAVPATIFLATGAIGTGRALWFDRLALAFRDTTAHDVITPWTERLELTGREPRLRALSRTLDRFKRMADEDRERAQDVLLERLGLVDESPLRRTMLDWNEVRDLRRLGFTVGAHTVTHAILSRVTAERARAEIAGSRLAIAAACGDYPRTFAYPNGGRADYTAGVVRMVREAGFSSAVTTRLGVNASATPPYELRRGGPWEHELPTFALKLAHQRLSRTRDREELVPAGGAQ